MKIVYSVSAVLMSLVFLPGCDSNDLLGGGKDTQFMVPEPPSNRDEGKPRPPADEPVLQTSAHAILDITGEPLLTRGIDLQYGDAPMDRAKGIDPIAATGANIIRIQLRKNTSANDLREALIRATNLGLVAMVTLWEPEIYCSDDSAYLIEAVEDLWLEQWLPVLAERQFQSNLMINIASGWGPESIFDEASRSYSEYIDTYKILIQRFRDLGFKVPLVIDAPGCGRDSHAFMGGRARELRASDSEDNIVLSVHAYHRQWNSSDKIRDNLTKLYNTNTPVIVSEFGGSNVNDDASIDHIEFMRLAEGDFAMVLDIPWLESSDRVTFATRLDEVTDVIGTTLHYDLYVPRDYVDDNNLRVDVYLRDSQGRSARLAQPVRNLRGDAWNKQRHRIEELGDLEYDEQLLINLAEVTDIGFTIDAQGKSPDILGQLKVDNFALERGEAPEPVFHANFDTGTEGFQRSWGAGAGPGETPVTQADGQLLILPVWGEHADDGGGDGGATREIEVSNYASLNMDMAEPFSMSADVFIPEEYTEALNFAFVLKDRDWNYGQMLWVGSQHLPRGEVITLSVQINNIAQDAGNLTEGFNGTGAPNAFAFTFQEITSEKSEPIRVNNFVISGPEADDRQTLLSFDFAELSEAESFRVIEDPATNMDAGSLVTARQHDFGLVPFGWIATTWFGNRAEFSGYNLSFYEGYEDDEATEKMIGFTERGLDIILGENGISDTAKPATLARDLNEVEEEEDPSEGQ